MGLTGKNNEEKAWNFLKGKIPNDFGVAGLMGELFAESGLNPVSYTHLKKRVTDFILEYAEAAEDLAEERKRMEKNRPHFKPKHVRKRR